MILTLAPWHADKQLHLQMRKLKPKEVRDLSDIKQRVEIWSHLWNGTVIIAVWLLNHLNNIISISFYGSYVIWYCFVNDSSLKIEFTKEPQEFNDEQMFSTEKRHYHSLNAFYIQSTSSVGLIPWSPIRTLNLKIEYDGALRNLLIFYYACI